MARRESWPSLTEFDGGPMKVVVVGTLTNRINGSARSFLRICQALRRDHEVCPIVPDYNGYGRDILAEFPRTICVQQSPLRKNIRSVFRALIDLWSIWRILRKLRPDAVYVNDIPWVYIVPVCRVARIPVIVHCRFDEPSILVRRSIGILLNLACHIVFVSQFNWHRWRDVVTPERSHVIHNPGIRVTCSNSKPRSEGTPYCVVVSRISKEKGISEAISLFAALVRDMPELNLIIAGAPIYYEQYKYQSECKQQVQELGLVDHVKWVGTVDSMSTLYSNAWAFIHLPVFEDPFPTTIMEALAFNVPIITCRKGGIPEQVEGFSGVYFVDNWHPKDLVTELAQTKCIERTADYNRKFSWQSFENAMSTIVTKAGRSDVSR